MALDKIKTDCVIVGSGPAGLSAAIYLKRAGLGVNILTGQVIGGQLTTTTEIENYAGVGYISGTELMTNMINQVKKLEVSVDEVSVKKILQVDDYDYIVICDGVHYYTRSILIATGASAKYLGLDSEQFHLKNGSGVSACATCDGFFYRNQSVAVIGGGDTAFEEAIYLSKIAKEVHLINRSDKFRASQLMVDRANSVENITIHTNKITTEIVGKDFVEGIKVKDSKTDEVSIIDVTGAFIAIGHKPNTDFLKSFTAVLGSKVVHFTYERGVGELKFLHFELDGELYKYCGKTYEKVFKMDSNGIWLPYDCDYISELEYIYKSNTNNIIFLDEHDYIITNNEFETNWKGVYAAGDVQDTKYRQAITSAGDGCKAAMNIISKLS